MRRTLRRRLRFFGVSECFSIRRLLALGPLEQRRLDFGNRTLFFVQVLLWAHLRRPRVIYSRDFSFMVFLSFLPRWLRPRAPVVYEQHKIYHRVSAKVSGRALESRALAVPDLIVPISTGIARDLGSFGVDLRRIRVCPSGIRVQDFSRAFDRDAFRARLGIAKDDVVVTYAGSWDDGKGLDVLFEAFQSVSAQFPGTRLWILGTPSGALAAPHHHPQARERLDGRVRMPGFLGRREVIEHLKASEIGVVPNTRSILEGLYSSPLKLFEYMAAGLAVVASDLPNIRSLVSRDQVLLVEPEDPSALAAALATLVRDPERRRALGARAEAAVPAFSYEQRCLAIERGLAGVTGA